MKMQKFFKIKTGDWECITNTGISINLKNCYGIVVQAYPITIVDVKNILNEYTVDHVIENFLKINKPVPNFFACLLFTKKGSLLLGLSSYFIEII